MVMVRAAEMAEIGGRWRPGVWHCRSTRGKQGSEQCYTRKVESRGHLLLRTKLSWCLAMIPRRPATMGA